MNKVGFGQGTGISTQQLGVGDLPATTRTEVGGGLGTMLKDAVHSVAGAVLRSLKNDTELLRQAIDELATIETVQNRIVDAASDRFKQFEGRVNAKKGESAEKLGLARTEKQYAQRALASSPPNEAAAKTSEARAKAYLAQKSLIDTEVGVARTDKSAPTGMEAKLEQLKAALEKAEGTRKNSLAIARDRISKAKEALEEYKLGEDAQESADLLNKANTVLASDGITALTDRVASKAKTGENNLDQALGRSPIDEQLATREREAELAAEEAFKNL